ncbi:MULTISPECIES: helix-turn-helix domain-containing protein [unclassified Streptomyces]|uniref:helix-turn-helix domain-containing protein n=1 Tax=unclassified Streptomyces TaxID=2593676 RepID=UPI002E33ADE4|nr:MULTISPECIES: helix-turn-helix domain-containing protein [unclassified Streptomyces]
MTEPRDHPFVTAVKPLVDAMGGELMDPAQAQPDDVVLSWEGQELLAVRLPQLSDSLDHILAALERRHGVPLAQLDRKSKQDVVRILEARGAFSVRHGVETVASALGVSRFTVYNYLNRDSSPAKGSTPPKGSNPPKGSGLPEGAEKNSQS